MNTRAELIQFPVFTDNRGVLVVGETGAQLPFTPLRFFATTGVPGNSVRGRHAHYSCQQVLVALHGSCRLVLIDSSGRDEVHLNSPSVGLFIPNMVWLEQFDFAPDTAVLVLASELYDDADYIRTFAEFQEMIAT